MVFRRKCDAVYIIIGHTLNKIFRKKHLKELQLTKMADLINLETRSTSLHSGQINGFQRMITFLKFHLSVFPQGLTL